MNAAARYPGGTYHADQNRFFSGDATAVRNGKRGVYGINGAQKRNRSKGYVRRLRRQSQS
jgi:hypothetical protein